MTNTAADYIEESNGRLLIVVWLLILLLWIPIVAVLLHLYCNRIRKIRKHNKRFQAVCQQARRNALFYDSASTPVQPPRTGNYQRTYVLEGERKCETIALTFEETTSLEGVLGYNISGPTIVEGKISPSGFCYFIERHGLSIGRFHDAYKFSGVYYTRHNNQHGKYIHFRFAGVDDVTLEASLEDGTNSASP